MENSAVCTDVWIYICKFTISQCPFLESPINLSTLYHFNGSIREVLSSLTLTLSPGRRATVGRGQEGQKKNNRRIICPELLDRSFGFLNSFRVLYMSFHLSGMLSRMPCFWIWDQPYNQCTDTAWQYLFSYVKAINNLMVYHTSLAFQIKQVQLVLTPETNSQLLGSRYGALVSISTSTTVPIPALSVSVHWLV